ncbi:hypothetical protein MBLNU459_g7482t1 [Dothideomycetes sp. NU459]
MSGSEGSESPEQSAALTEAITEQVNEWSTNSTEAFHISLIRGNDAVAEFNPEFTYPIFGEEEAIFGYRDLNISLAFAAHNLKPHLELSWQKQFQTLGKIQASDVRGTLEEFVPESAFTESSRSDALADTDAPAFTPPGERVHAYKIDGQAFEVWCASAADPAAKELLENVQVLVPLFIEGGTMLQLEQPWVAERWKVFLLYQVHEQVADLSSYALVGFSTSYRVFTFPDRREPSEADLNLLRLDDQTFDSVLEHWAKHSIDTSTEFIKSPLDLPSRERISQFLILPPYQRSGHGPQLYNAMYNQLSSPANVCELTVEDPNEAFDDMRDVCDLVYLRENSDEFASLSINTNIDAAKLKPTANIPVDDIVDGGAKQAIKKASKIMPRQLGRLVEMQVLSKIPQSHRSANRISRKEKSTNDMDKAFYFWRLYVKQRLYVSNRDTLMQLDREERAEKLDLTVENVQEDYQRLIALADKRAQQASRGRVEVEMVRRQGKKRKLVVDDEDDEDDEDNGITSANGDGGKKIRTS